MHIYIYVQYVNTSIYVNNFERGGYVAMQRPVDLYMHGYKSYVYRRFVLKSSIYI
jgi:hypothetical protein